MFNMANIIFFIRFVKKPMVKFKLNDLTITFVTKRNTN